MEKFLRLPLTLHLMIGLSLSLAVGLLGLATAINHKLEEVKLLTTAVFTVYWLIYPFAISMTLALRVSPKISLAPGWYLVNWGVTIIGLMILIIASYVFEQDEFHLEGPFAIIGFYFFYAFIYSFLYPARLLKITEKNEKVWYGESLGAFLALTIVPFNFLLLHKRVLNALDKPLRRQSTQL